MNHPETQVDTPEGGGHAALHLSEPELRAMQFPAAKWLIEDELPAGYTIMMGAPKTGKTALLLPMAQQLADAGYRVMYLALDDSPRRMQERSIKADPERSRDNLWFCFWAPQNVGDAFDTLETWLVHAATKGRPFDFVVVDTYGVFVGARPSGGSVFSEDYLIGQRFKRLYEKCGASVFVSHHTRKGNESDDFLDMMNGSGGIAASADAIWYIRRTRGSRDGVLKMTSNDGEDVTRPVWLSPNLVWEPSKSVTVAQAEHTGCPRDVLDLFALDPHRGWKLPDIVGELDAPRNTVRRALQDLSGEGLMMCHGTEWRLTPHAKNGTAEPGRIIPRAEFYGDAPPPPPPAEGAATTTRPCTGCGLDSTYQYEGKPWHVECRARAADAEALDQAAESDGTDVQANGFRMLQDSVTASRMKPVLRIPAEQREQAPWSLITERMSGEHRWARKVPSDCIVGVFDRNGSYPSAMSAVPVAANVLTHTGAMEHLDSRVAGIFEVPRFVWDEEGVGHPLGRIADSDTDTWWITTPHMLLVRKLIETGRIAGLPIIDSWTGRRTDGLFTRFSKETQQARLDAADDPEEYAQVKRTTSVAIRCLWPKGARSPFWRPDWNVSVRAEASVRHWVRADQAGRVHGHTLVKIGSVDEVAFIIPDSAPKTSWVPEPYELGTKYGQVKIKDFHAGDDWNGLRGVR
jgi:hypothetical protein